MTRQEAIAGGFVFYCMKCDAMYKEIPTRDYARAGGDGYPLAACRRCSCDLFARLDNNSEAEV